MANTSSLSARLADAGVVPVIRLTHAAQAIPLVDTLNQGGLPVAEITLRTPCAVDCIKIITNTYPDFLVGAGTVVNLDQAKTVTAAGVKFIVSPGFVPEVVAWCLDQNMPVFPGVCTPTEICQALSFGLRDLKFFPASLYGGLPTIKALLSVFSDIRFMPTGGISLTTCGDYLKTPGILCCGGSFVTPLDLIEKRDYPAVLEIVKQTAAVVATVRGTASK